MVRDEKGYCEILTLGLDDGAHVNATGNNGITTLMQAASMDFPGTVRPLLKPGAPVKLNPLLVLRPPPVQ